MFGYRRVLDSGLGGVDDGPVQVEIRAWITYQVHEPMLLGALVAYCVAGA